MTLLNIVLVVAIGITVLMALFHLQRFIFFLWFKYSTRDREIIINIVMNQLARNNIKLGVPAELTQFIYKLLDNQEHGSQAADQIFHDIMDSLIESIEKRESESKEPLIKEKPNDN